MPLYTTEAIILRTYKLGEADRIVVFLTRDRGKRRGVAQGARRMRSRFGGALEPLTRVAVTYFEKESRELVSLNYAEPLSSPLWAARSDALGHTGYFAELIDECALEGDADDRLYRLGSSVVDALAAGVAIEPLARYFEVPGSCGSRACIRRSWSRCRCRTTRWRFCGPRRGWAPIGSSAWPRRRGRCANWRRCIARSSRRTSRRT